MNTRSWIALAWIFMVAAIPTASLRAQGRVDPVVRVRLDREFAAAHPQPGDYLPSCDLQVLDQEQEAYPQTIRFAEHGYAQSTIEEHPQPIVAQSLSRRALVLELLSSFRLHGTESPAHRAAMCR